MPDLTLAGKHRASSTTENRNGKSEKMKMQLFSQACASTALVRRLTDVLASPGEAFAEVKVSPYRSANWVVPGILVVAIGWIGCWLVLSHGPIRQNLKQALQEGIAERVEQHRLAASDVDLDRAQADAIAVTTFMRRFEAVLSGFGFPLLWAFYLWLVGTTSSRAKDVGIMGVGVAMGVYAALSVAFSESRFPKYHELAVVLAFVFWSVAGAVFAFLVSRYNCGGSFPYRKALELAGLTNIIAAFESIVATLLALIFDDIGAAPNLALLAGGFDRTGTLRWLLAQVNIVSVWQAIVISIGLKQLSNAPLGKSLAWVLSPWILYEVLMIGVILTLQINRVASQILG